MKKRNYFPALMKALAAIFGALTLLLFSSNGFTANGTLGALAVSALTFFYHFAMRLAVGALVPNQFCFRAVWFRPLGWESTLYRFLKVRKWKKYVPTFAPETFDLKKNSLSQVLARMCQSEVVHEVIVVCSFLPLLFSLVFGEFWVFFITSVISALIDLVFVCLQRFNRPRLMGLLCKEVRDE